MKIYGHRGASATEPENTLPAFRRALELGVDGIEFDVQATSDRVPVILHDRDLGRTTNGKGAIESFTFEELRRFDAGNGECVPTLAEVLALASDQIHLDIEIKQGGIEPEVLAVLAEYPQARWTISSFDWTALERVRTLSPDADIWLIAMSASDSAFSTAHRVCASGVALYSVAYTETTAARFRDANLNVTLWTINDPIEARRVRDLGAYAICTDDPALMLAESGLRT